MMSQIPRAQDTCQSIIAKPSGELGQGVRRERCNYDDIGPVSQINVKNRVAQTTPTMPLLVVCFESREIGYSEIM
jgi:hypothetical protein